MKTITIYILVFATLSFTLFSCGTTNTKEEEKTNDSTSQDTASTENSLPVVEEKTEELISDNQKKHKSIFYCGYGEGKTDMELCEYYKSDAYTNNINADLAIEKILQPLGLPQNFVLVSCQNINNAIAVTSDQGTRYIVIDPDFIEKINNTTSNWSCLSILAHEIGHHLCGHTLKGSADLSDQRNKELEADEFSGFVMFKLGATLEEAQAALATLSTENDDSFSTHPKRSRRLNAISAGYNRAKSQQPIKVDTSPSAEKYFLAGTFLSSQEKYFDAIEKYNLAIEINPKSSNTYFNRGIAKYYLGNYTDAISDYTKAIEIDPTDFMFYDNRGAAKGKSDDYKGAILDFNQSLLIDPNDATAYLNRGLMKINLNDTKGACEDLLKSCNLGDDKACNKYSKYCKYAKTVEGNNTNSTLNNIKRYIEDYSISLSGTEERHCKIAYKATSRTLTIDGFVLKLNQLNVHTDIKMENYVVFFECTTNSDCVRDSDGAFHTGFSIPFPSKKKCNDFISLIEELE